MLHSKNKIFHFSQLNPRLQGVLGGIFSIALLAGLVFLSMSSFENARVLQSDIAGATGDSTVNISQKNISSDRSSQVGIPVITSVTPTNGNPGDVIFIGGELFSSKPRGNIVDFAGPNGVTVTARQLQVVNRDGKLALRVVVPVDAKTGNIILTVGGVKSVSPEVFTIGSIGSTTKVVDSAITQPQILSLSKYAVKSGDKILVTGTGLSQATATVKINGLIATLENISKNSEGQDVLLIKIPDAATSGFVTVEVAGQTAIHQEPITITSSRASAPRIDTTRNRTLPNKIDEYTDSLSFYTFVSDPDGADDIVSVSIDLSSIGGKPSNPMVSSETEGNGLVVALENFLIPDLLTSDTEYRLPIIATDKSGQVGRAEIVFCVGVCVQPVTKSIQQATASTASTPNTADTTTSTAKSVDPTTSRQPLGLTTSYYQGFLKLSWRKPKLSTGITDYYIYYSKKSGDYLHRISAGLLTDYFLGDLKPGERYYIAITSVDAAGIESAFSTEVATVFPYKTDATESAHAAASPQATTEVVDSFDYGQKGVTSAAASARKLASTGPAETLVFSIGLALLLATGIVVLRRQII